VVVVVVVAAVEVGDVVHPWSPGTRTRRRRTSTTTPSTLSLVALDPTQTVSTSDTPWITP